MYNNKFTSFISPYLQAISLRSLAVSPQSVAYIIINLIGKITLLFMLKVMVKVMLKMTPLAPLADWRIENIF